jgi:hypothetical protein
MELISSVEDAQLQESFMATAVDVLMLDTANVQNCPPDLPSLRAAVLGEWAG